MANVWYVSSVAYSAITQFAATHTYNIGDIIQPLTAPAVNKKMVYRCTTGGASTTEPTWGTTNSGTTTSGAAVFTNVTGNSTYGWLAAAGDLGSVTNDSGTGYAAQGDTIYTSSDHSESITGTKIYLQNITGSWTSTYTLLISVNRGGSVPPVATDITSGTTFTVSSSLTLDPPFPLFAQGLTFSTGAQITLGSTKAFGIYLKNCALQQTGVSGNVITNQGASKVTLENTTIQFGGIGQNIAPNYSFDLTWINTASAIQGATLPTNLFRAGSVSGDLLLTCRGIDLSAITGALVSIGGGQGIKALFESCKIASGATIYSGSPVSPLDIVELINCWDGSTTRNERYLAAGQVTTERVITKTGGALDDIGTFSNKFVSNSSKIDKYVAALEGFWFDVEWNGSLNTSHTATVEIISSGALNNDDIALFLEYQGTAGSNISKFSNSLPSTLLTANASVTSSSATWNSSPSTPVAQKLQVIFTPQVSGRVRGLVRLGKTSTTVYVDPVITIT